MKTFSAIILLTAVLMMSTAAQLFSQTPEQIFQKGLIKEEGEGSLLEAVKLYNSVADNEKLR